ncbi:hypothetical protein SteCoe_28390 [Stentor coeruleus]|uniref:Uncharacterized protein n=1 Tax=Stentor coeruleus TaxID=5963 RepID=A0A1R2B8C4_9CILI|nr:hypothetical protein SteCoe_28390 [Stentor coeruleus]
MQLTDLPADSIKTPSSLNTSQEKSYHGNSQLFNNRMNAFFSDTSYTKHKKNQDAKKNLNTTLINKETQLSKQTTKAIHASICLRTAEKWIKITNQSFKHHYDQEKIQNQAALTIQRHFRGFWTRVCIEDFLIKERENRVNYYINESSNIANRCFFDLGLYAEEFTIILQRATRRFLLRLKYYRMIKAYNDYIEAKQGVASDIIKKFLLKVVCKEKIHDLVFIIKRDKKLLRIRKNLALILLRKFWKKRKLSFKIIKDKLLRLKRKRSAMAKKEEFQKMLTNPGIKRERVFHRSYTITSYVDDDEDTGENVGENASEKAENLAEKQRQKEEVMKIQKEKEEIRKFIKEKAEICKTAYGIKDEKQKVVIPYLQERELNENVVNSLEIRLYEATESKIKKSIVNERKNPPRVRNLAINTSPKASHKHFPSSEFSLPPLLLIPGNYIEKSSPRQLPNEIDYAHFMSNSKHCKHRTRSQHLSFQPNPEKVHYQVLKRFLISTTTSSMMKKTEKRKTDYNGRWNNTQRQHEYTPSLDNPAYTPQNWKPIELDRNILGKSMMTHYSKSPNKGISNPTSIISFSSGIMNHSKRRSMGFISNSMSTYEGSTEQIPYYIPE